MTRRDSIPVDIQADIYKRIQTRIDRTEFRTPDEYINLVLEEVLDDVERDSTESDIEAVDEEAIRDQLRALGYADE